MNLETSRIVFITILALGLLSCNKEDRLIDCTDKKMKEYNLLPYNGEELDCDYILELYVFNNQQYFHLYNPCLFVGTYPVDCSGEVACGEGQISCSNFYERAEYQGIIGYRKYP